MYIGGKEDEFKGFGEVPGIPGIEENPCAYLVDSPACKLMQAQLQSQLNGLYANAGKAIQGIASYNPILAQALAGARDPSSVLARAQQLGNAFKGNISEQEAYKLFYIYGRSGLDMLSSFAGMSGPLANSVQNLMNFGVSTYPQLQDWADRITTGKVDVSIVADGFDLASRAGIAITSVAGIIDSDVGKAIKEVVSYLNIAKGCVTNIAAGYGGAGPWGAAAGAVMCGISLISKIFGAKSGSDPYGYLRAVFYPYGDHQQKVIAKDAQRLAALLKYHYGVKSFKSILDGILSLSSVYESINPVLHPYPRPGSNIPLPGWTFHHLDGVAWYLSGGKSFDGITTPAARVYRGIPKNISLGMNISVPEFWTRVECPAIKDVMIAVEKAKSGTDVSASAITKVGDWINFFAAVSALDLQETESFSNVALPIRFRVLNYDSSKWTPSQDWGGNTIGFLYNQAMMGIPEALQVVGALRLLAAFSYLHMQYELGSSVKSDVQVFTYGKDIISGMSSGGSVVLRAPSSPKGKTLSSLISSMKSNKARLDEIEDIAKNAAMKEPDAVVSGSVMRQILLTQAGAPAAAISAAEPVGVQLLKAGLVQAAPWWTPQTATTQAPSGVGTVAVIGAAALAALMLLRK